MARLEEYSHIVKKVLTEDARYRPSHGQIDPLLVFDDERHSYQLMYVGWDNNRRVHSVIIHIRLHNDKIWIEYDGTEEGVATALLAAGVPKEDIVLAFHAPEMRKYTEFAVA
ncbi:MAG: XisI protein [Chloroflexota bacterium]